MYAYLALIATLAFTLAGDTLFTVAIIWRMIALGGSAKTLALFLCLIMLVTFILQKISTHLKKLLEQDPRQSFALVRMIGIFYSLGFLPLLWHENIIALYAAGMVFSIVSFYSTLTVEAIMGQEVLQGRLNANYASRILQTAMQIAAFLGASLAGFVLGMGGMMGVLLVNVATYASGALIFSLLLKTSSAVTTASAKKTATSTPMPHLHTSNQRILWITFIGLFLLMAQITAFNFLVPQISQLEKAWTATQFGLIDAAAGLGAFLCTFVVVEKGPLSALWVISFLGILAADITFHMVQNAYSMLLIVFMLGFFVNAYRIKQRELMYNAVSNTKELYEWTSRITVMTAFVKALLPLLLALILFKPSVIFILCGLAVSAGLLIAQIAYYLVNRQRRFQTAAESAYG